MTSKTVVLHIGTDKTGTTSIQRSLANAQERGSLAPVCYPIWPGDRCQRRLAFVYAPYEKWTPGMRQEYPRRRKKIESLRERYRRFLFGELRSASGAILSTETLCHFDPRRVAHLRADLEAAGFGDFRVVLYVRDPADFYVSHAQQMLKNQSGLQLIKEPDSFRYNFLRMAENWEQVFPGKLIVRKYSDDPDWDVVDDFGGLLQQYLGVSLGRAPRRENTTLSAEGMRILQDYREIRRPDEGGVMTRDVTQLVGFLEQSRLEVVQTKPVLKQELAALVRANHQADAEVLHARYGVDLGLGDCAPIAALPRTAPARRVNEILESVDPEIVHGLLLRLARTELNSPPTRTALMRAATRMYRSIPPAHRPVRIAARIRTLL